MVLVQRETNLPVAARAVKREVLLCLMPMNLVHEYDDLPDLLDWLDEQMAQNDIQGLRRATLFYADPYVRLAVEQRMQPSTIWNRFRGDGLTCYQQPGCWMRMKFMLPMLRQWAERYEPGFVARELAKDTTQ